jgi:hypothetical protein
VDLIISPKRAGQKADFDEKKNPKGEKVDGYGASGVAAAAAGQQQGQQLCQGVHRLYGARGSVQADGSIRVYAEDTAGIDSNSTVVQSAVTSNTAEGIVDIVNSPAPRRLPVHDRLGHADDRIRRPSSGRRRRTTAPRAIRARCMSIKAPRIPRRWTWATENFKTANWHKLAGGADNLEDLYPGIGNFTDSDARAVGILVVMNDVRSDVEAYLDNAVVQAAERVGHRLGDGRLQARPRRTSRPAAAASTAAARCWPSTARW